MDRSFIPTFKLEGIEFCGLGLAETAEYIVRSAGSGIGGWVVTPNVDIVRRFAVDAAFRDLISQADLFTPDGAPIVWAVRISGGNLSSRVPGSDLVPKVCEECSKAGLPVAFIGGNPGTALASMNVLTKLHPALVVAGCICPSFGFEKDARQVSDMEEFVRTTPARVVFVGLGSPKQERLINGLRRIRPDIWWLGVGATFSFIAGEVTRAPVWMQKFGLEWAHRLLQEPRRLFHRYLIDDLPFAIRMLLKAIINRILGSN